MQTDRSGLNILWSINSSFQISGFYAYFFIYLGVLTECSVHSSEEIHQREGWLDENVNFPVSSHWPNSTKENNPDVDGYLSNPYLSRRRRACIGQFIARSSHAHYTVIGWSICHQFQMPGSWLVSLLNLLPCFSFCTNLTFCKLGKGQIKGWICMGRDKTLSFGADAWYNQEITGDKNDMHTAISWWYICSLIWFVGIS
jgi:hypothetical protein